MRFIAIIMLLMQFKCTSSQHYHYSDVSWGTTWETVGTLGENQLWRLQ